MRMISLHSSALAMRRAFRGDLRGLRATHWEVSNKMVTSDKHSIVHGMMLKCFGYHDERERKASQKRLGTTSAGKSNELRLGDRNGLLSLNGVISKMRMTGMRRSM
jgi:hypothetical protein